MSGADIYAEVKAGTRTLAETNDQGLRELLGHLGRKGKTTGTAGRIWGEAMAEATVRFINEKAKDDA